MKKTPFSLTILPFGLHLFTIDIRAQMQSTNYRITTTVVFGGGGPMASASFQANDTIGQPTPIMEDGMDLFGQFRPVSRLLVHDGCRVCHKVAKAGGVQSQGAKGEAVVIYCDPLATQDLGASGFPGRVKNEKIIVTSWITHLVISSA